MDPITIGQQIKQTHPEYAKYSDQEVGTRYIQKYGQGASNSQPNIPSGGRSSPVDSFTKGYSDIGSGVSNAFRTLGLGYVPDVLGSAAMIPQMVASNIIGKTNPTEAARLASQPSFLKPAPEATGNLQDQFGLIGRDLAGVTSWLLPELKILKAGGILPAAANASITGAAKMLPYGVSQEHSPAQLAGDTTLGALLGPIFGLLKSGMLTKGGAANAATNAAENSTATKTFDELSNEIRAKVLGKFGNVPEVTGQLEKNISAMAPELPVGHAGDPNAYMGLGDPSLSASNILDFRRQMTNRGGQNFIQRMLSGSDVAGKVDNATRQVLSSTLHSMVPETLLPDQLYSLYANKGVNAAKAGLGALLLNKMLPGGLGGIFTKLFQ